MIQLRNMVNTIISTFLFSCLTWKKTKLVLLSLATVTLVKKLVASAVPESTKNHKNMLSMPLKVRVVKNLVLRKFKLSHFIK